MRALDSVQPKYAISTGKGPRSGSISLRTGSKRSSINVEVADSVSLQMQQETATLYSVCRVNSGISLGCGGSNFYNVSGTGYPAEKILTRKLD